MLDEIIKEKAVVLEQQKRLQPLSSIIKELSPGNFALSRRLKAQRWNLIAECKLQSPSKGTLCSRYDVRQLAKIYAANGAAALSVHTDRHFAGKAEELQAIRKLVQLPILRKDFIIDEYQIYESRMLGADAILLIVRVLSDWQLQSYLMLARSLGMDCLVEVHSREDIERLKGLQIELLGINNRDLQTFRTDFRQTLELIKYCDSDSLCISESGIDSAAVVRQLQQAGLRGILVGEGLVRAADIVKQTKSLALMEDDENGR